MRVTLWLRTVALQVLQSYESSIAKLDHINSGQDVVFKAIRQNLWSDEMLVCRHYLSCCSTNVHQVEKNPDLIPSCWSVAH